MTVAPGSNVASQLNMSLDEVMVKALDGNRGQARRPTAARAHTDRRGYQDKRNRAGFNQPRGIVKQRSAGAAANTYGSS